MRRIQNKGLIFATCAIFFFFYIQVWNIVPMHTTTDELGGIVSAAYIAGLDWSGVIHNSGYYGFGWYWIFFPLFMITDNPIVIYRVIAIGNVFLKTVICPIVYYIGKHYLEMKSEVLLLLMSVMIPLMHAAAVGLIANEYPLDVSIWLSVILMCKYLEYDSKNSKRRILYAFLFWTAGIWSLTIHTRAITTVIASSIILACVGMIRRKYKYCLFGVTYGVGYLFVKIILSTYQNWVFQKTGGELRNAVVSVAIDNSIKLNDGKVWDVWLHMLIGMFGTEGVQSAGLFIIAAVIVLYYMHKRIECKDYSVSYVDVIISISVLCMGANLAAFLVSSWFRGIYDTWGQDGAGSLYTYKGMMYVRYWNSYVPLLTVGTIGILSKLNDRKIVRLGVIIAVIVGLIYASIVVPIIETNGNCASFLYGVGGYEEGIKIDRNYFLKCIAIELTMLLILLAVLYSKASRYSLIIFILFFGRMHLNEQFEYNELIREKISSKIMTSYELYTEIRDEIELDTIYVNDETGGTDNNWKLYSVAQFYFNRYTIQDELPSELESNDIIISTSKSENIKNKFKDIKCYVLDENEVWYTYLDLDVE